MRTNIQQIHAYIQTYSETCFRWSSSRADTQIPMQCRVCAHFPLSRKLFAKPAKTSDAHQHQYTHTHTHNWLLSTRKNDPNFNYIMKIKKLHSAPMHIHTYKHICTCIRCTHVFYIKNIQASLNLCTFSISRVRDV